VTGGSLPGTFTLSSSGVISGLVSAPPGVYQFTVTATDSSTPPLTAKANLSIAVIGNLNISTKSLPAGELGVPYTGATLASYGGTAPITWTINPGNLPPGLSLNTATGAITGTPTADGTWTFEVYANDSGITDPQEAYTQMSIVVQGAPLQITPSNPPQSDEYQSLSWQLAATGGQPPDQWTEAGALPKGVTLNASTGLISGTPTVTGSYNVTVTVKDSTGAKASALEPIDINPPLPLYVSTPPAVEGPGWSLIEYGQPYSVALSYGGGEAPYTFAVTAGSLPPGLALNRSTGVISGTPTENQCNPPAFTVTITDSEKPAVKASIQVTLNSLTGCA
jgi:large repetitive protein